MVELLAALTYQGSIEYYEGTTGFTDLEGLSDISKKAIAWCASQGYIKGYDEYNFGPNGTVTRAEAAIVIARLLEGRTISITD
jgi:hypothetical protein